jgi:hypothetical protein
MEHPQLGFDVDLPADLWDAVAANPALRRLVDLPTLRLSGREPDHFDHDRG